MKFGPPSSVRQPCSMRFGSVSRVCDQRRRQEATRLRAKPCPGQQTKRHDFWKLRSASKGHALLGFDLRPSTRPPIMTDARGISQRFCQQREDGRRSSELDAGAGELDSELGFGVWGLRIVHQECSAASTDSKNITGRQLRSQGPGNSPSTVPNLFSWCGAWGPTRCGGFGPGV